MATGSKKRKSTSSKKRFIGKPTGKIQERVQAVGPSSPAEPIVISVTHSGKPNLANIS